MHEQIGGKVAYIYRIFLASAFRNPNFSMPMTT